jgi:hypothetical protein
MPNAKRLTQRKHKCSPAMGKAGNKMRMGKMLLFVSVAAH